MSAPGRSAATLVVLLLAVAAGWWLLHPERIAAPASSAPPAPVRDLGRDERAGGHTLARHVGLDDAALRRRLEREPALSVASSFVDRATAERAVGAALEAGRERVGRWLASDRRSNLVVRWRGDGAALGRVLLRGATTSVEAKRARVVLRRNGAEYFVLTAYPESPR